MLEQAIPKTFGNWRALDDIPTAIVSPEQAATLELIYDQILNRTYVNQNGQRIMLSVTYGKAQNQRMRAHRQEVCYGAQGFEIHHTERQDIIVAGHTVPATRFVALARDRVEPVTYWFTMGDKVVLTYLDRELQKFKYALTGYIPDGYLFRISTLSDKPAESYELERHFAEELLAETDPRLSAKLLGSAP